MRRGGVLIGCTVLGLMLIAVTAVAGPAGGWLALINDLLGENDTHLVLVRGTVRFDGDIDAGGDFTVIKNGDGLYFVAYATGTFIDTPTVLVQPVGLDVDANEAIAYVESETLVGFVVETKFNGVLTDRSFKFIAAGPR